MSLSDDVARQLESLNENIKDLTSAMRELIEIEKTKRSTKKKPASSQQPLSDEQRIALKSKFESLYSEWASGNEFDVRRSLEEMDLAELRHLVDAANISQDNKASKEKLLRLIVTRFREIRMLGEGLGESSA